MHIMNIMSIIITCCFLHKNKNEMCFIPFVLRRFILAEFQVKPYIYMTENYFCKVM